MEKNIYIIALEYGVNKMGKKLTYIDMRDYIVGQIPEFSDNHEVYFVTWFFQTFYNPRTAEAIKNIGWLETGQKFEERVLRGSAKMIAVYGTYDVSLTAEGYFNYIEYVELKDAREASQNSHNDATRAFNHARLALWISASLAAFSIIFGGLTFIIEYCK